MCLIMQVMYNPLVSLCLVWNKPSYREHVLRSDVHVQYITMATSLLGCIGELQEGEDFEEYTERL